MDSGENGGDLIPEGIDGGEVMQEGIPGGEMVPEDIPGGEVVEQIPQRGSNPLQQFSSGFSSAMKPDVDAIKNRATNTAEHRSTFGKRKKGKDGESESEKPGLEKKDGLEDKKSDKDEKSDKKEKAKGKADGKGKTDAKGSIKDQLLEKSPIGKLKAKWIKIKIILIAAGVALGLFLIIFIFSFFAAAFNNLLDSISTFFGLPGANTEEDMSSSEADGLLNNDKYFYDPETGESYTVDGLVTMLKKDTNCSKVTLWTNIGDWFSRIGGTINDVCSFIRYIETKEKDLEKANSGLVMDRALVISTIFYGYSAQPDYSNYDNPNSVENIIPASEHFDVLKDILEDGKLKKADLDKIINYSVSNTTYTYYDWIIKDSEDGKSATGYCKAVPVPSKRYSLLKWKIFMRFGETAADAYDKLSAQSKAWSATGEECRGEVDEATLLAKVAGSSDKTAKLDSSVQTAINALSNSEVSGLDLFEQHAKIDGHKKDSFESFSGGGYNITFDYKDGFIYNHFPIFKEAFQDSTNNIEYNSTITPKEIESIVQLIEDNKPSVNQILQYQDQDRPYEADYTTSVVGASCQNYLTAAKGDISVTIQDCDGRYVTTTDFKDYIMGVAYGEVSNSNDDYVMAEMAAAASFALYRRDNYTKGTTIMMKSGNCDQVYCPMKSGCHPVTSGIACGTSSGYCTSYLPGGSGYHTIASQDLYNKYSALYDKTVNYLLVTGDRPFCAHYNSTLQNQWYAKAASGMSFTQILQETYANEGATLIDCSEEEEDEEDDDIIDETPVGNVATTEYPEVSPTYGKYYGYAYRNEPDGREITINPVWKDANLIDLKSNCSAGGWDETYKIHKYAKSKFEKAFSRICGILTDGVKLQDGSTCKLTTNDLKNGETFVERKTSSGSFSLYSYGLAQAWNYDATYEVDGKSYTPYARDLAEYNGFISALGNEEDCRNVNYILWKYAYQSSGFKWGGDWERSNSGTTFDGKYFEIKY